MTPHVDTGHGGGKELEVMTVTREYGIGGPEVGLVLRPSSFYQGFSRGCSQSGQQMVQLPTLSLGGGAEGTAWQVWDVLKS